MKTDHLFDDHIYLISNHAVARNPIFCDEKVIAHFKKSMQKYLSPICNIINYCLQDNEFQLLVKLKSRAEFEQFYNEHKRKKSTREMDVPESTYIFSQEMSNMQVSLVKHVNKRFGRTGGLMAGRFRRQLVESADELQSISKMLSRGNKSHNYQSIWKNHILKCGIVDTGAWIERAILNELGRISVFRSINAIDLAGHFEKLPPYSLNSIKRTFIRTNNSKKGPD